MADRKRPSARVQSAATWASWPSFALLVGLSVGLIVFGPYALQGLSALRAAQYETNEQRSELETNERFRSFSQLARSTKRQGGMTTMLPLPSQVVEDGMLVRRGIAETRLSVAAVVYWSPSMRC